MFYLFIMSYYIPVIVLRCVSSTYKGSSESSVINGCLIWTGPIWLHTHSLMLYKFKSMFYLFIMSYYIPVIVLRCVSSTYKGSSESSVINGYLIWTDYTCFVVLCNNDHILIPLFLCHLPGWHNSPVCRLGDDMGDFELAPSLIVFQPWAVCIKNSKYFLLQNSSIYFMVHA